MPCSLRLQHTSRSIWSSPPPHVPGPAACLLSSQSPYLYTSTSLRLQRTLRAPELHTSPTRPYACTGPPRVPDLQSSTPPRPYTCTGWTVQGKLIIRRTKTGEVVGGKRVLSRT